MVRPLRRIGLSLGQSSLGMAFLEAIPAIRLRHPQWEMTPTVYTGTGAMDFFQAIGVDGLIIRGQPEFKPVPGIPVVAIAEESAIPDRIRIDEAAIGTLAARLLIDHHRSTLATAIWPGVTQAFVERVRGFKAASQGRTCLHAVIDSDADAMAWVAQLPAGTGVFAVNDVLAYRISLACRRLAIAIPDQLALIGVDDDPVFTRLLPQVGITSVRQDVTGLLDAAVVRLAYRAGWIRRDVHGVVAPLGIAERASTAPLAGAPLSVRALALIRQHAVHGLGVGELADRLGVTTRSLERHFRQDQGRGPLDAIHETRLALAENTLRRGGTVQEAAQAGGFSSPHRLRAAFHRFRGDTPLGWLRRQRKIA